MKKIKIAVSACLLGQNVRYDGGNKFINLKAYFDPLVFEFIALCPEVEMGMSIPRPPIQIINDGQIKLVQVDDHQCDYTEQMKSWFKNKQHIINQCDGFILKSKSPSCGNQTTQHYGPQSESSIGDGYFVALLKNHKPHIPIIDENSINNLTKLSEFKQSLLR